MALGLGHRTDRYNNHLGGRNLAWLDGGYPPSYGSAQATKGVRAFGKFFADWNVLSWNDAAIAEFEQLVQNRIRIGTMDLKIASIALANDATVLTGNASDFSKVPNLRIEDWLS